MRMCVCARARVCVCVCVCVCVLVSLYTTIVYINLINFGLLQPPDRVIISKSSSTGLITHLTVMSYRDRSGSGVGTGPQKKARSVTTVTTRLSFLYW